MLKIFNILIVVGLAVIVGCGAARQGNRTENSARSAVYMLIINDGYDQIKVYDSFSKIATITSGRSACFRLRNPERSIQFSFSYITSRKRWYAPEQHFAGRPGWVWTINSRMPVNSTIQMNIAEPCGNHRVGTKYYRYNNINRSQEQ